MKYAVLAALLVVMILVLLIGSMGRKKTHKNAPRGKSASPRPPCPLCGSSLDAGERIRSVVFRDGPETSREQLVHLFGCPLCSPPHGIAPRVCPVCHKRIPEDGYLIGRMWDKPRKKHLHILGCTVCRVPAGR